MSILSNVKKKIIVNAGHFLPTDKGFVCENCGFNNETLNEAELTIKIRDELLPMLKRNLFDVTSVPDDRNLRQSIDIANVAAPTLNDGLCMDIHLNSNKNPDMRGVEMYSGTSPISAQISRVLSKNLAKIAQIPDRGYKPHTQAFVGSLGWIVQTNSWAVVAECAFLSNKDDRALLQRPDGPNLIAKGILYGILELYGMTPIEPESPKEEKEAELNRLQKTIDWIKGLLVALTLKVNQKLGRGKF